MSLKKYISILAALTVCTAGSICTSQALLKAGAEEIVEETTGEYTEEDSDSTEEETVIGPQADGSFINRDGDIFTAEQIENSEYKPVLSVSKITVNPSQAGETIPVTLSVSGAEQKWCASSIDIFLNTKLNIVTNSINGDPEYTLGNAAKYLGVVSISSGNLNSEIQNLSFMSAATGNYGLDGDIVTYYLTLPDELTVGEKFELNIDYCNYNVFLDYNDTYEGRLMEAYVFTKGLEDGYIEVVSDNSDSTDNSEAVYGDADGDGSLSVNDVVKVMCYSISSVNYPLSESALVSSDVYQTGDGVNSSDAFSIQKKLVNIISALPES